MLYEYRHVGRRRRSWPQTFELMRNMAQRDDGALYLKCHNEGTPRGSSEGGGIGRPSGSVHCDDFTLENMAIDIDSAGAFLRR
jgi:hypothetical protein